MLRTWLFLRVPGPVSPILEVGPSSSSGVDFAPCKQQSKVPTAEALRFHLGVFPLQCLCSPSCTGCLVLNGDLGSSGGAAAVGGEGRLPASALGGQSDEHPRPQPLMARLLDSGPWARAVGM